MTFQSGRVDCATAPYTDDVLEFPTPDMNMTEVFDYYDTWFNMTEREVTIIQS